MLRKTVSDVVRRRVPQVVGVYLAGSWALLEFMSWASERGRLPATVVDDVLLLVAFLLPMVVVVAWRTGGEAVAEDAAVGAGPAVAGRATDAEAGPPARSVAILPFASLSAEAGDAYLADGISEEIITALARVDGLRVASRTSSFVFRDTGADVREIGRRLGVGAVLEGSVQRAGDRLRVAVRLASAADGFELWSSRWDAAMAELFRIEDEIADGVARALKVLLGDGAGRAARRTDVRAYEHYLKGRQYLHQTRRRSMEYARQLFARAIEVDPEFALAHAAYADTISQERMYYPAAEVNLGRAEAASLRALELEPELAEARSSHGLVLFMMRRFEEAEAEFRRAMELDPALFDAHYFLARMFFQIGRTEEAAAEFTRANEIREDPAAAFFAAQAYEALGREEEARTHYEAALRTAENHMELSPDDARVATMRAVAACRTGRVAEGLEWGERAVEIDPRDGGVRYNVACLFSVAGERERAVEFLEAAVEAGFGNRDWIRRDPDLANVRDDPRVVALLQGLGDPATAADDGG